MGYTPPYLYVAKGTGQWVASSPSYTSTDDLILKANATDTNARLDLLGAGSIQFYTAGANTVVFISTATPYLTVSYASPDVTVASVIADKNLSLTTAGTGKIKFGTYTAGAATDSTGYISILDAAGNARKLMVQA